MYTLLKPIKVREELLKRGIHIFSPDEFMRIFNILPHKTKYFLETQVNEGLFARLKQGIYSLKTDPPAEEEIANALYKPSYLSFEYALSYYYILPEMPYSMTSATTKPTRLFTTLKKTFYYRTIKKEAFTGYVLIKQKDRSFFMAEKEKALVDYFYFIVLQKINGSERLLTNLKDNSYYKIHNLNKDKIYEYAKLFNNKKLLILVRSII